MTDRAPRMALLAVHAKQHLPDKLLDRKAYIDIHEEDKPEIRDWQ
jgi:xylulose-5-phosphate/fructose-6-phosphate phosphoketolase